MRILSHLEKQERKEHFVFCTLKGKGASALGSGNTAADVMAVFQLLTKADEEATFFWLSLLINRAGSSVCAAELFFPRLYCIL